MSSRNYIDEILDYQNRLTADKPRTKLARKSIGALFTNYNYIIKSIQYYEPDFDYNLAEKEEVLKYYPVGIVASIQGYFKLAIKDLIESGDPYKSKATEFEKELKDLNVKEILAIEDKKLTTADFIAHLVNLNDMDKINGAMNKLSNTERDFHKIIKSSTIRFSYKSDEVKEFKDVADEVFKNLYKVFRLRNIIAHEVTADLEDFKSELRDYIVHANLFISACENEVFKYNKLA